MPEYLQLVVLYKALVVGVYRHCVFFFDAVLGGVLQMLIVPREPLQDSRATAGRRAEDA